MVSLANVASLLTVKIWMLEMPLQQDHGLCESSTEQALSILALTNHLFYPARPCAGEPNGCQTRILLQFFKDYFGYLPGLALVARQLNRPALLDLKDLISRIFFYKFLSQMNWGDSNQGSLCHYPPTRNNPIQGTLVWRYIRVG